MLYQELENYGLKKGPQKGISGPASHFTDEGTKARSDRSCSRGLFTVPTVPAGWPRLPSKPREAEGLSPAPAHPGGSSCGPCCPPCPVTLVPEQWAQQAQSTSAELFPPYLPACLLAPPHPPRRNPEPSPWGCEATGMWHSDPWQRSVLDGPAWETGRTQGRGRRAPWPRGGMEGKEVPSSVAAPGGLADGHHKGHQVGRGVGAGWRAEQAVSWVGPPAELCSRG